MTHVLPHSESLMPEPDAAEILRQRIAEEHEIDGWTIEEQILAISPIVRRQLLEMKHGFTPHPLSESEQKG